MKYLGTSLGGSRFASLMMENNRAPYLFQPSLRQFLSMRLNVTFILKIKNLKSIECIDLKDCPQIGHLSDILTTVSYFDIFCRFFTILEENPPTQYSSDHCQRTTLVLLETGLREVIKNVRNYEHWDRFLGKPNFLIHFLSNPQPNLNEAVGFYTRMTLHHPHKLNVSKISAVTDLILMKL